MNPSFYSRAVLEALECPLVPDVDVMFLHSNQGLRRLVKRKARGTAGTTPKTANSLVIRKTDVQ
jgi:hypothetical protein